MTANEKEVIHERIKRYSEKLDLTIDKLNTIDKEVALMKQTVTGLEKEMSFHVGEIKDSIKDNIKEVREMLNTIVAKEEKTEEKTDERKRYYYRLIFGGFILLTIGFIFGAIKKGL